MRDYVYLLESIGVAGQIYVGHTNDLRTRLDAHNAGQSPHTAKYKPWRLVTYLAFSNDAKAVASSAISRPRPAEPLPTSGFDEARCWQHPRIDFATATVTKIGAPEPLCTSRDSDG